MGASVPFSATAAPFINPGRGGTKLGGGEHPAANRNPSQWHEMSNLNLTQASSMHLHSDDLSALSLKTHNTTRTNNIDQYQAVHGALAKKVDTSRQLVDIIEERIRSVTTSIQRTKTSLGNLQAAYNAKKEPLSLCTYRQTTRARRPNPREMIRDGFETALEEEKETLLMAQDKLQHAMDSTERMIQCLTDSLKEKQHDHEVKSHSLNIDEQCLRKTHVTWPTVNETGAFVPAKTSEASMPYVGWHLGAEEKRQQDTLTRNNRAKEKEAYAQSLRDENDALIAKTSQDCQEARSNVEHKMQDRIREMQSKRRELEMHIQETVNKIEAMQQMRAMTDSEIRSHEQPENILKHRMELRAGRQHRENISDPVTTEFLEQSNTLKQSRAMLDRRREEEKQSMAMLLKTKADLEADLSDKTAALHLDLNCQQTSLRESKVLAQMFFS